LVAEAEIDGSRTAIAYAILACGLLAAGAAPLGRYRYFLLLSWPVSSVSIDLLTATDVFSRPADDWIPVTFGLVIVMPAGVVMLALGAAARMSRARGYAQQHRLR
jgi:hypothetical protein